MMMVMTIGLGIIRWRIAVAKRNEDEFVLRSSDVNVSGAKMISIFSRLHQQSLSPTAAEIDEADTVTC